MKKTDTLLKIFKVCLWILIQFVPTVIVGAYMIQFFIDTAVAGKNEYLNSFVIITLALSTIMFNWAACIVEKDELKVFLLKQAKNLLHAALMFIYIICLMALRGSFPLIKVHFGTTLDGILLGISKISISFLALFGCYKITFCAIDINKHLVNTVGYYNELL